MAHTNFLLSCIIGHYSKGNRSRLTLLWQCSTPTMTCCKQFVQIPYLPPPSQLQELRITLYRTLTLWINFQSYWILAHTLMLILLQHSTSFSQSHLSNNLSSFVSLPSHCPCCGP